MRLNCHCHQTKVSMSPLYGELSGHSIIRLFLGAPSPFRCRLSLAGGVDDGGSTFAQIEHVGAHRDPPEETADDDTDEV